MPNAQLDDPIASDVTLHQGYHSPMEGNSRQAEAPTRVSTPVPPPPPWPPYYPPTAKRPRRWLPAAIVGAAGLLAGGLVSAALIVNHTGPTAATPNSTSVAAPSKQPATRESSTCAAWSSALPTLKSIPDLPAGWDWDTPNIDVYIANHNASVGRVLDLFEPKIAADPADIAATAHEFVSARRNEMALLSNHTYHGADGVAGSIAFAHLNQLCGTS